MTLPAQDIVERLRQRVDRWKLNGDSTRVSVPLGELRGVLAEIETNRTAFDGIEPTDRAGELEEAKRLLANSLKEYAPISAASHRSEVQAFLVRAALRSLQGGEDA